MSKKEIKVVNEMTAEEQREFEETMDWLEEKMDDSIDL